MRDEDRSFGLRLGVTRLAIVALFVALALWRSLGGDLSFDMLGRLVVPVPPAGLLGAFAGGATAVGSGFVTVPAFDLLRDFAVIRVGFHQLVATAGLVQAFAMAMATLGWIALAYRGGGLRPGQRVSGNDLIAIVFATLCAAVPTVLIVQINVPLADRTLQTAFIIFSLALGGILIVFSWAFRKVEPTRDRPERFDLWMFLLIGVAGGYVTAFFSLGIGEFLIVYLVFRKFPVVSAVTAGVAVSAVTAAAGAVVDTATGLILWDLAVLAVPAALVGGALAPSLAARIGPLWLTTAFGLWVTASSLAMIVRALA